MSILEKLKNHFIIIAAARRIKLAHNTFLSNFEKIEEWAEEHMRTPYEYSTSS